MFCDKRVIELISGVLKNSRNQINRQGEPRGQQQANDAMTTRRAAREIEAERLEAERLEAERLKAARLEARKSKQPRRRQAAATEHASQQTSAPQPSRRSSPHVQTASTEQVDLSGENSLRTESAATAYTATEIRSWLEYEDRLRQKRDEIKEMRRAAVKAQRLEQAALDPTTSDIEQEYADCRSNKAADMDFPVTVFLKLFVNRSTRVVKRLPETSRFSLELADIESLFNEIIGQELGEEDYTYDQILAAGKTSKNRYRQSITLTDFGSKNQSTVDTMLKQIWLDTETDLHLCFDVKINCPTFKAYLKRKAQPTIIQPSIPAPAERTATPLPTTESIVEPVALPNSGSNRRRTGILELQAEARASQLEGTTHWQNEVIQRWQYKDPNCPNYEHYCWLDPGSYYYRLNFALHEMWALAIVKSDASFTQPPMRLLRMLYNQGPVTRLNKRSEKKSAKDRMAETMERFTELLASQMEAQMISVQLQMVRSMQSQFSDQMGVYRPSALSPLLPPPAYQAPLNPRSSTPSVIASAPVLSQIQIQLSAGRLGSPFDYEDDHVIIEKFFNWLAIKETDPFRASRIQGIRTIINDKDWSLEDLMKMEDPNSHQYLRATAKKVPDGTARGFKR